MKNFKKAFTLAEVLITLSIIGVVAALTAPTLMANYSKKVQVTSIRKFVNQLEGALESYMADNRADTLMEAGFDTPEGRKNFFTNYFKIETDCESTRSDCFASSYSNLNGVKKSYSDTIGSWCNYAYTIKSGASFCIPQDEGMYSSYTIDNKIHKYDYMYIDTNGKEGPNIAGRDFFLVFIFEDGSIDEGYATPECRKNPNTTNCRGKATLAAARVVNNCKTNADVWPAGCLGLILNNNWKIPD